MCLITIGGLMAQTLVSTNVETRNAMLEEYTGIHCTYCPEGHAIAAQLNHDYPYQVFPIAIHQGSFANPNAGEPDYRTEFGDALAGQTGLTGYPSGTVNRHVFSGTNTALGRSAWAPAAMEIIEMNSVVNVGAETSYNEATRELTVNVELYYTANSSQGSNFLNVALLQNKVYGPQIGGGAGNNYEHNHMLRYLITGQWGEEITTTTEGTFVERTYTYTIPEDYNQVPVIVENCDIAVFVSETQQEIYSGVTIPAIDGTTLITASLTSPDVIVAQGTPNSTASYTMDFTNLLPADEEFEFTLSTEDAPEGWTSSFTVNSNTYQTTGIETIETGTPAAITIDVTPDSETGFAKFFLSIQSVSQPNAAAITQEVYLVSNVVNLLLHNQGTWNGGTPADLEDDYYAAFEVAGVEDYTSCSYKSFLLAANEEDIINSFTNIFFNVAWTFPGLTNRNVEILSEFIDNGGNLFIAGQDMGWDTWDPSGNGTLETKAFYTNYLNADYKGDGSTTNNSINPNTEDEFFGDLGTSSIVDIYGGNMYPDEIDPIGAGEQIIYYNGGTSKGAGVRSMTGSAKVVYLGFDPSMVTNVDVRNDIIVKTFDWFLHGVGFEEMNQTAINVYPNPFKDQLNISTALDGKTQVDLVNVLGINVYSQEFNTANISINAENLENGVYILVVKNASQQYTQEVMIQR